MRRVAVRPPSRPTLAAAVAVLALAVALGGMPTRASAESEEAPDPATITTTLQPGWNMVAWLGPEAPVTDLFEAIPALERVSAWDATEERYQRRTRTTIPRYGLRQLTTGMGLWLELGGDEPFEWTRPVLAQGTLLPLHAGRNLVGWVGRDGTPIADALERFGESLVRASRWDAAAQAYEHYRPGESDTANTLAELNHGDGLWVELTGDARWWQSGTAPAAVVSLGDFTEDELAEVRRWMDSARAIYMERWSVGAPMTIYVGDLEALTPTYRRIRGHAPPERFCGNYHSGVFFLWGCIYEGAVAHDYFHAIQDDLSAGRYGAAPSWLIEGSAEYAERVYTGSGSASLTVPEHVDQDVHQTIAGLSRYAAPELSELTSFEDFHAQPNNLGYRLGFVAVDWLVGHSSEASTIAFFRALAGGESWQEAFERAFGIAVDDFYEAFEAYRAEVAPPLPHLVDDSDEPVLVLVGEMPLEAQAAVRTRFASIVELFGERLAAGSADYTVYIGADAESLADVHLQTTGNEVPEGFCSTADTSVYIIATVDCVESSPRVLQRHHSHSIRARLAPLGSLPPVEQGHDRRGPLWLLLAIEAYADHAHETAVGPQTLDEIRAGQTHLARRLEQPLSTFAAWDDLRAAGFWRVRGLSSIAGEWLADRASEAALFDYFRQLPTSDGWEAAFEAAFGMSVDDFHAEFEAHRSEVAPPLPHLVDGSDEPVLVLLGEMSAETEAAVRTTFAHILEFFGERLEAGPADYTVYVGADAESLTDVHTHTTGHALPEDFCTTAYTGVFAIVADCMQSSPLALLRHHFFTARDQLAPWGSLAAAEYPADRHGPMWLLFAIESYVEHTYGDMAESLVLDQIRADQTHVARRLEERLGTFATWDDVHAAGSQAVRALSSIAGELLAERAGEPALLDYFRQLPTSGTWEVAFEAAFGMGVEEFHTEFEAHRAQVAPPYVLYRIRGVVLDPTGNPSVGAWMGSSRGEARWEDGTTTGEDGAFELAVRDGRNQLYIDLSTTGCSVPTDGMHTGSVIEVDGADVSGVDLRLPEGSSCDQH